MELPDLEKFVFNETEMERLMALEGTHGALYDQKTWRVTVTKLTENIFTFMLSPLDFIHGRDSIGFYYYRDTGKLHFTYGDRRRDLSFVLAFLNGYVPCDLGIFRR